MTHDDYFNMLNNAEDLDTQIQFCETLAKKWLENQDSKMATMFSEMALNLKKLKGPKTHEQ